MSKWKTVRLGDVCEKGASNITQNEIVDNFGEYPIYGAAGFIKNVDFYKQEEAYIGIVKDGAGVGRISIHPAKSSLIGTMQYIFPNENIDIKFLASFLKYQNLGRFYTGATIPHIYFKDYKNIKLKLPPLETQKQIAAVLDKCTSLISKYKKILEKYDTLIKSRFIEMFGENPVESGKWKVSKLNTISDVRDGTHDSPSYYSEGYPFITTKNLIDGTIDFSTASFICKEDYELFDKRSHVNDGDILMPMIGTIGGAILVKKDREFAIKNVALIKPNEENTNLNFNFLLYVLNSDFMVNHFNRFKTGGTQKFISLGFIRELPIPVPPLELQNSFASFVQQIDKSKFEINFEVKAA